MTPLHSPSSSRLSRALVAAFALALPFKAGGCGQTTACITLSQAQIAAGTCPTQDEASGRIVTCGGSVASVDGPGSLDGDLCCYPITDSDPHQFVDCGFGGGVTSTGFTDVSSSSGFTTGFGGSPANCGTCNAALQGAPFGTVCSGTPSGDALQALRACACASACTNECDPTICFGNAPDDVCLGCMNTACAAELMACQQN